MSLLTSVGSGSVGTKYYIENLDGNGDQPANDVPCIKAGSAFGAIRIADVSGMVLVGGGIGGAPLISGVRGGGDSGTTLTLGSSVASASNIILTDGLVTMTTDLVLSGAGSDLSVGGDINLINGVALGKSISGYYSANTAVAAGGAQANPAGLTAGVYNVLYVPNGGAQGQQPSGVFVWSGTQWFGSAMGVNFTGPVPDIALYPSAGNATLTVGGALPSVPGALFWRKLLN